MLQTINNNIKVSHRDIRLVLHSISIDIFQFLTITSTLFTLTKVHLAGVVLFKYTKASITNIMEKRKTL